MPRIKQFKQKYMVKDFPEWIVGRMKNLGITQEMIAQELHITRRTFINKMESCNFKYEEILIIFKILQATEKEKIRLLTLE